MHIGGGTGFQRRAIMERATRDDELGRFMLNLLGALQGAVDGNKKYENHLEEAFANISHLRDSWGAVWKQHIAQRDHDHEVISQLKADLGAAHAQVEVEKQKRLKAEADYRLERSAARNWQDRYQLVDEERKNLEDRLNSLLEGESQSELLVEDVELCPNCSGPNLVHSRGNVYECLYCGETFIVRMGD
jgi:hypothetical protein